VLAARVGDQVARPSLRTALLRRVQRARARSAFAAAKLTTGGRRPARASLRRAVRALARFRTALRSQRGRRAIPSARRAALRVEARGIASDLRQIRHGL
jgi:hypothetical protein